MRDFLSEIKDRVLVYDGSKGYMLQQLGMKGGECAELWNVEKPERVREVYRAYKEAGSDVLQTNTFPGNRVHLEKYGLGDRTYELNFHGVKLAKEVAGEECLVAASIGPTGLLFEPSGELTFDEAYEIFKLQVQAVVDGGADLINFETFTDIAEMRTALLAAREITDIPVICSMAYEAGGRTLMGSEPRTVVAVLTALGADMIGVNCSMGAEHMLGVVKSLFETGGGYLSVKPNAGLPEVVDGKAVYKETAESFAGAAAEYVGYGARLIGGCCGTTPEYIRALKMRLSAMQDPDAGKPAPVGNPPGRAITSSVKYLQVHEDGTIRAGRLDAGMDEALRRELSSGNIEGAADAAMELASEGNEAVYVNVDAAGGVDRLLEKVVNAVQGYVREPLILETSNPKALESALRIYKGVAGVRIGSKVGEPDREQLIAAARKYGSVILN